MKIGISYDLKGDAPPGAPDDHQEEYDSPVTVEGIADVLRGMGHEPILIGNGRELLQRVLASPPDLVFNFAEGQGVSRCREARVPAVLEMLGIPHTGPDPLTAAATLDKDVARRLVASHGGTVPWGILVQPGGSVPTVPSYPCIVKPAWEGSSKGIRGKCVVDDVGELTAALVARRDQGQPLLVEEFIAGEELTVGVLGNADARALGTLRVVPLKNAERFVYSLEVKRDYEANVRYESPPALPTEQVRAVEAAAVSAFHALGCRDVARIDYRLRDGVPYFLEANPLPGLNPVTSDLVILARLNGIPYERLVGGIVESALARIGL